MEALIEAAHELAPDIVSVPRKPLAPTRLTVVQDELPPVKPRSRWMRRLPTGDEARDAERGQSLAEYALILALIAVIAILVVMFVGSQVSGIFSTVGDSISR